jgi:murein DD-endopeptidase MepM/ murein hydrolase activator NlpD
VISKVSRAGAAVVTVALVLAFGPAALAQESPSPTPSPSLSAPPVSPSPSPSASPTAAPTKQDRVEAARRKLRVENTDLLTLLKKGDELRGIIDNAIRQIAVQRQKAEDRLVESRAAAARAAVAVRQIEAALKVAIADLVRQKGVLNDRAAAMYIIGPQGYLPAMLAARDINDALAAAEYGRRALQYEAGAVIAFRAAEEKVRKKTLELRARKRALDTQMRAAEEEAKALQELQKRQWEIRNNLFTNMGANVEALSKLLGSENPFGAIIASYSTAGSGFTDLINEAQAGQKAGQFVTDWLQRPVTGEISSPFGYRIHPIYGYVSFHTGIDISADEGLPIHPAQAGTVIDAGYFGAFGNTIVLDHGNHIATIYAHLSSIMVAPGDRVKLTTIIGRVGSTGWSTGPHLHFEVRLGGKPQEPSHWL